MSEHDLSEFKAEMITNGPTCGMVAIIEGLPDEQKEKLGAALSEGDIPSTAIARVLTKWTGQKVTQATVRRHRRNECACG